MRVKYFTETELVPVAWMKRGAGGTVHVFNPAILRGPDGLVMAYRVVLPDESRHIAMCRLRNDWSVIRDSVAPLSDHLAYADAPTADPGLHAKPADPRLLTIRGRLYMHFNSGSRPKPNRIYLVEIDPATLLPIGKAREVTRPGPRQLVEKNWMLFEHADEVFAVYQFSPLVILRVDLSDPERVVCTDAYTHEWDSWPYEEAYGELRGGATPVRHDGRLYFVTHSLLRGDPDPARPKFEALCYVGAVVALADRPPFAPVLFSPRPVLELLATEQARPHQPRLDGRCQEAAYPDGAVGDADGLTISYGVNERYSALRMIDWADLHVRLIPVVPFRPERAILRPCPTVPAPLPRKDAPPDDVSLRVYWWRPEFSSARSEQRFANLGRGRFVHGNFGDLMVPHLMRRLTGMKLDHRMEGPKLMSLGSLIQTAREGDVIWGTGLNGGKAEMQHAPKHLHIYATRGPISREFLRRRGYDVSRVNHVFDPANLLVHLFSDEIEAMRRHIGNPPKDFILIPHFRDDQVMRKLYPQYEDQIVSPDTPFLEVVGRILRSELVVSSSLHGLIVAETLGIPAVWHRPLMGENEFKFHDYYLGTDRYNIVRVDDLRQALRASPMPVPTFDPVAMLATFPPFEDLDALGLVVRPVPLSSARMVHFNVGLPGSVRLLSGWSAAERHGVWSVGDVAELELFVGTPDDQASVLEIFLAAYVLGDRAQRVTVSDDMKEVGTYTFPDPRPMVLRIALSDLAVIDSRVRLRFHIPTAVSPASLERGADGRRLGISLQSVRLRPATMPTTREPDLRLRVGERAFVPVSAENGRYVFDIPAIDGAVSLLSRCSRPEDRQLQPLGLVGFDRRQVGVRMERLTVTTDVGVTTITAEDPRLDQGWWAVERREGRAWRWTNGEGMLPLDQSGAARVELLGVLAAVYAPLEAPND